MLYAELLGKHQSKLQTIAYPYEQMMTHRERQVMAAFAIEFKKTKKIFEFGTWQGMTTFVLAQALGGDCEIHTLDWTRDSGNTHNESLNMTNCGSYIKQIDCVKQIDCDSMKWEVPLEFIEGFDFVLVDGNHTFDYVKADTEKALQMIRDGGVIFWDNVRCDACPDVRKYLDSEIKDYTHVLGTDIGYKIIKRN